MARRPARRAPRILVQVSHRDGARRRKRLEALAGRFLEALGLDDVELSLSLVDDGEIRTLNRTWRKKDKPTDVLSFPAGELPPGVPGPRPLGDIVISLDTTRRQAAEQGSTFDDELALYLAHGLLHLLGHDHETPREARAMSKLEDALLGMPGMVNRAGVAPRPERRQGPKAAPAVRKKAASRRTPVRSRTGRKG